MKNRMRRAMLAVALGTIACSSDHVGTGPVVTRLVFSGQPSTATAGVVITPGIQVTALDDGGVVVTSFSGTITIALGANPGGATLSGTLTRGAIGGVATFSDLRLNRTGSGYTFLASAGALTTAPSSSFVIAPAPPVQLTFAVQPTDVVAGVAMTPAVQVQARDSLGNLTPSFTGSVTLVLAPNGAGAVLGGTTSASAVAGVASFAALHVDKSGSAYAMQAAAGALAGATSTSFNVAAAAAKRLAFTVEPNAPIAGLPMSVQVVARDTFGNTATGFGGSVAIAIGANPSGSTFSGTTPVTAVSGTATFSDLSLSKSGTGYTLVTSAAGLIADTTAPFTVSPGSVSPASTVVAAPTSITASNGSSSATITVTALDALGNPVPGAVVTLSATGTATTLTQPSGPTDANGVATGSISATAIGAKVVSATVGGVLATQTASVTVTPASAASLGFTVQPTTTSATGPITPAVQVTASDAFGNRATGFAGSVTIAIGANPSGGTLAGTLVATADTGVATFPGLSIDKAGAGYTLVANSGALGAGTSQTFTIAVGSATKLGFSVEPSSGQAGAAITPAVQVSVRDAGGNLVSTATNSITLAIGANPGAGTLSGTNPVAAASGIAQFANLTISKSGVGYTLVATASGLAPDTSTAFNITAGGVSSTTSTVVAAPTSITASSGATSATITVTAKDPLGNPVAGASVVLAATGAGNTVTQPAGPTDSSGVATGHLSSTTVGAKVVSATIGATPVTQTDTVSVTPAAAASLAFTVQPTTTVATTAITPAVQVTARDAFGNRATGFSGTVTVAIGTNPGGGTLTGTLTAVADTGVATFANLKIDKAAAGYTLVANSGALTQGASNGFTIAVGPATKLAFAVQPSNATAGGAITPAVQVAVQDAGDNLVSTATNSITIALGNNPSGGSLSGALSAAASGGIAQFSNLSIDKAGTGYTLQATASGVTTAVSTAFDIGAGAVDHLAYIVQPSTAVAGVAIAPAVQVEVEDAIGNRVTTATTSVTVAILDNPNGGVLSGTATRAAVAGVATFSNLSINKSGTGYSLSASATGLTGDVSADFNIIPATAARASFFVEPSATTAGSVITPGVQVEILDAFGNRVPTATNSVTLTFAANPGSGTLSGTATQSAVAGLASFSDLSIDKVGNGYKLRAGSSGLTPDTSVAFNVTPGPATTLVVTQQPTQTAATAAITPSVKVTARDAQGNTATGFTGIVSMAIATNPGGGTLSGTSSVSAVAGVATFSDLHIDKIGTGYTLGASATGLSGATSNTFSVVVGSAAQLSFFTQPGGTTGGATLANVQVEIQDAGGNRVTGATNSVSLAFGTNANDGTLSGTIPRSAVSGVATFDDLSVDSTGAGYTLAASAGGLGGTTSTPFNITVGSAAKVGFLVPPSNTVPGQPISPDIQVEVRDLGGNRVTSSGATVSLAIGNNPSSGTLSGTTSHAASSGLATFPGLSINNAGSGYTLIASSTGLTDATSPAFDISVGSAVKLGFFVQPTAATGGATIAPAVQVEIQDVGGNRVAGATNSVTLAIGTNPNSGTLAGTKTVAAVNGVAMFSGVSIDSAGAGYTLDASASGLTGATSAAFNITVGLAAKLGFHVAPSNGTGGVAIAPAIEVEVQDAGGNRVTSAGNTITISLATNPKSGTLSGTTVVGAASGIATFANLSIDSAASGYRLGAAASGLTGATSATFTVAVGTAAKLGYLVQPSDVTAGVGITPAVKVEVRDAGGNRVTTANNTVAIGIGTNAGGGTLSGTTSHGAVSGVATFSGLSIDKSGAGYTLAATASGLTGATSSGFTVSADGVDVGLSTLASSADTVGQCTTSCNPAFQASTVTVTVKDQFGNPIAGSPVVVSANGTGNVFSPSGSGTTDATGTFTATYNASVAENKTLAATAGGSGLSQTPGIAVMPVLVGAGDIADCNSIKDDATANQLDTIPGTVFADGDNAYTNGTTTNFTSCYDPTWGRHKARTRPVVGNHEYDSSGTAAPYFTYFGAATADPLSNGFGYYSYDLGAWHIVVLNSDSGVTNPSSGQLTWLQNDLVGRTNQCVVALWHRPIFTSGSSNGAGTKVRRLWQALENAGAEVVINGHDHLYERFAPQDSLGNATSAGIREFIVGTGGGESHGNFPNSPANVEASDAANFSRGVLRLTLYPNSYRWEFLPAQGFPQAGTYTDSGTGTCH
jgi:Bacterial Ig-like domain (group 1)/Calcineurin-like phosphoesterase